MRIDRSEVERAGDQEQHDMHGGEIGVIVRASLGGLKQAVERFQEAVGLTRLGPDDDAVEALSDHAGNLLHGLDLGAHHVDTPLLGFEETR